MNLSTAPNDASLPRVCATTFNPVAGSAPAERLFRRRSQRRAGTLTRSRSRRADRPPGWRMARPWPRKHGLAPTSDFDAVRLLAIRVMNPFQRFKNMLGARRPADQKSTAYGPVLRTGIQLPQTVPAGGVMFPRPTLIRWNADCREIRINPRGHTKRPPPQGWRFWGGAAGVFRRGLPTLIGRLFISIKIATPMYATDSQFRIIQNEGTGRALGPAWRLLPTQSPTLPTVSRRQKLPASPKTPCCAWTRRGTSLLCKHFSDPEIDPIQRLHPDCVKNEGSLLNSTRTTSKIGLPTPRKGIGSEWRFIPPPSGAVAH